MAETTRLKAKTVEIVDAQGFDRPITAYRINLPENWTAKGQVLWRKPCSQDELIETVFRARSPDGRHGVRIAPGHAIIWMQFVRGPNPYADVLPSGQMDALQIATIEAQRNKLKTQFRKSNCHVGFVEDTEQLVRRLLLPSRPPGTRVVNIRPQPEIKASLEQLLRPPASLHPADSFRAEAALVRLGYDSKVGPIEEDVLLSWALTTYHLDGVTGGVTINQYANVFPLQSSWAPAGELDKQAPINLAIWKSLQVDGAWNAKMTEVRRKIAAQRRAAQRESFEAHQDSIRQAEKARGEAHEQFIDYIRGRERITIEVELVIE